ITFEWFYLAACRTSKLCLLQQLGRRWIETRQGRIQRDYLPTVHAKHSTISKRLPLTVLRWLVLMPEMVSLPIRPARIPEVFVTANDKAEKRCGRSHQSQGHRAHTTSTAGKPAVAPGDDPGKAYL